MVKPIRLAAADGTVCAATITRLSRCSDFADGAAPLCVAFEMSLATLHAQSSGQRSSPSRGPELVHPMGHSSRARAQRVGDPT
jgi:hypothetical protein